jgi:phosphate transport system permease protein
VSLPETGPALAGRRRLWGDTIFRTLVQGSGVAVLALIAAIAIFLVARAEPAFRQDGLRFFTERQWLPELSPPVYGVAALAFGTVLSSGLALVLAVPVAVSSALFVTELAPPRLGRWLGHLVDLLAAVPSVVFGLWGLVYLVPRLRPVERVIDHVVGGVIPIFHSRGGIYGRSIFGASVILAIMVLPIVAAVAREVFRQTPRAQREAALALGATRWETIRLAVLPLARSGVVGAVILGLGRALGETIAVALVLSPSFVTNVHVFEPGNNTIAANIATKFGEAGPLGRDALIASGVVLFVITLLVNIGARSLVFRYTRTEAAKA